MLRGTHSAWPLVTSRAQGATETPWTRDLTLPELPVMLLVWLRGLSGLSVSVIHCFSLQYCLLYVSLFHLLIDVCAVSTLAINEQSCCAYSCTHFPQTAASQLGFHVASRGVRSIAGEQRSSPGWPESWCPSSQRRPVGLCSGQDFVYAEKGI